MASIEDHAGKMEKKLIKKAQTLEEIAAKIGKGVTRQHLARAAAFLVREGRAVKVEGRPAKYSKPA